MPNVQSPPFMVEARRAGHPSGPDASQVIGVDFYPDCTLSPRRRDEMAAHRAQCFGENHTCAAMEQSIGLVRSLIHRKAAHDSSVLDFEDFESDGFADGVRAHPAQFCRTDATQRRRFLIHLYKFNRGKHHLFVLVHKGV